MQMRIIIQNPEVHYRIQKIFLIVHNLSQINPAHITPAYIYKIHFNVIHPRTSSSPSDLFPPGFPTNRLYTFVFFPVALHAPPTSSSSTW
jgi:hypothetical protein